MKKNKKISPKIKKLLKEQLTAIIFAAPVPISVRKINQILVTEETSKEIIKECLNELFLESQEQALVLHCMDKKYQFRTHESHAELLKKLVDIKPIKLSRSALEVLTIIAYKQPVTRADVDHIRGVDSGHIFRGLLDKNLVRTMGHRDTPGKPIIYGTSDKFLEVFSLTNIEDLPEFSAIENEFSSKDTELGHDDHPSVLAGLPGEEISQSINLNSSLAANPDRGSFDEISEPEELKPDFGIDQRAIEELT